MRLLSCVTLALALPLAAVALLLLSSAPVVDVEATLWVGGSGSGVYFSREKCDVLGFDWALGAMPTQTITSQNAQQRQQTTHPAHVPLLCDAGRLAGQHCQS